jgi:hypothetical protein
MAVGQHGTALPAARTPDRQAQITFPSLGGTNSYVEIIGHFFPATENMLIRFHDCTERNNSESIQIVTPFARAFNQICRLELSHSRQTDKILGLPNLDARNKAPELRARRNR